MYQFFRLFHFTKVLLKRSLKGLVSLTNILHATISVQVITDISSDIIIIDMENCLPFIDDVMVTVVLVLKCMQQTHLLALHLETFRYIPRLLNALNGLGNFLIVIIGDPRGENRMVGSMFQNLLTELGIRTEDAECNLMGEIFNFAILVLIIKVVWLSTIPRQPINT